MESRTRQAWHRSVHVVERRGTCVATVYKFTVRVKDRHVPERDVRTAPNLVFSFIIKRQSLPAGSPWEHLTLDNVSGSNTPGRCLKVAPIPITAQHREEQVDVPVAFDVRV